MAATNLTIKPEPAITPKKDRAIRLYALGIDHDDIKAATGVSPSVLKQIVKSATGQKIINEVRAELEDKFQNQFADVINAIGAALHSTDVDTALHGAALWLKTNRAQKVEVQLTAEDVVKKLMSGEEV